MRTTLPRSEASVVGGRYSLDTLAVALDLTRTGRTDAILFGPLNKTSLHMAGMAHSDELHWFAEYLDFNGPFCEFNVLDDLWTSRVTSHVALADVPGLLSQARVVEAACSRREEEQARLLRRSTSYWAFLRRFSYNPERPAPMGRSSRLFPECRCFQPPPTSARPGRSSIHR